MNVNTMLVFKQLMAKGYISREDNELAYSYADDEEVRQELEVMEHELDFKLYRTGGRIYLIPDQTNELFLQNNVDFRRKLKSEARLDDIYLLYYIGIYLLYIFYRGSGKSPLSRDFIRISDLISDFTAHCEQIKTEADRFENASDTYSLDFVRIAEKWLAKTGELNNKLNSKQGCALMLIRALQSEELFVVDEEDRLKPTRKLNDLMPWFLSQQRIAEVNAVFSGGDKDAHNK